jgi:hypothetical protein
MTTKGDSDGQTGQSDQEIANLEEDIYAEHAAIPDQLRQSVLARDDHRCQINGCCGRAHNGSAQLLVQRIDKNQSSPADLDSEDLETRCLRCSVWIERMPTTDDLRPRIKQRLDGVTLEPSHTEILQYLSEEGPATTGEILENVNLDSKPGVRNALYSLMGLDVRAAEISQRVVLKNRAEQTYGLPWQIPDEHDARGCIPIRPSELRTRILDELVCQLYYNLEDTIDNPRELIASIVDREPGQIRHMRRRGQAFQFPFSKWADRGQSREDPSAVIAAVDALASETNNLSRQLLSRQLAGVYENNDEQVLAEMLRAWANSEDISPYIDTQRSATGAADDDESVNETAPNTDCSGDRSETLAAGQDNPDGEPPEWDLRVLDESETGRRDGASGEASDPSQIDIESTDGGGNE